LLGEKCPYADGFFRGIVCFFVLAMFERGGLCGVAVFDAEFDK
jgi:hypothetical protein